MASTFKSFLNSDITTTRTMLHEAVPITGSILARTYGVPSTGETNIKTYGHGMFTSIYDYPYLSSSSNHLMDVTFGTHPDWDGYNAFASGAPDNMDADGQAQFTIRKNIYTQMQQILVGHDQNGNLRKFDRDGNFSDTTDDMYNNFIFISLSRQLVKDEIKKGTFRLELGVGRSTLSPNYAGAATIAQMFENPDGDPVAGGTVAITDSGAQDEYRVNSPVGEYAILNLVEVDGPDAGVEVDDKALQEDDDTIPVGLIYYQAGIVVLNMDWMAEVDLAAQDPGGLDGANANNGPDDDGELTNQATINTAYLNWYWDRDNNTAVNWYNMLKADSGFSIDKLSEGFRHRVNKIQFQNTTELNSTIYFCRAKHNEFNYSSNNSYLDGSKIRVKENATDQPISFITTVGLYSADQELLAVAKLSEPLKKDPSNELALRVRLDY